MKIKNKKTPWIYTFEDGSEYWDADFLKCVIGKIEEKMPTLSDDNDLEDCRIVLEALNSRLPN
jgi:hypothetical protein